MPTDTVSIEQLHGFTLEYRLAPSMVVFSHGFGVRRDARGMFTDIVTGLQDQIGYVLFEYNQDEAEGLRLTSLAEQTGRLKQVIDWTRQQPDVQRLAIVAHSKGCTVTALAQPDKLASAIMLAPPLHVGSSIRRRFTTRPGAVQHGSTWIVPRSDGTTSLIDENVLDELDTVDGEAVVLSYAQKQPVHLIAAGGDRVLPEQDYAKVAACPGATLDTVAGASHDFEKDARTPLVQLVTNYLRKDFEL